MSNFLKYIHPLLKRSKSKTNYEDVNFAIIDALNNEMTLTEQETLRSKLESSLKSATGEYLDLWGEWFYVKRREKEDDDSYRARIIKFFLLKRGTNNAIIDAIKDFLDDYDAYINVYEPFTNIFYTNKSKLDGEDHLMGDYYRFAIIDITIGRKFPEEIIDIINEFKPAGVKFFLTYDHSRDIKGDGIVYMPSSSVTVTDFTKIRTLTGYGGYLRGHLNLANRTFRDVFDYDGAELINNVFRTDNSLMNSLDVLGGEAGVGNTYANTGMLTSNTYFPSKDDTPYTFSTEKGVTLLDSDFNKGTKLADNKKGTLQTLGSNKETHLYVGLDLYRYLRIHHPEVTIDTTEQSLKDALSNIAKNPKLSFTGNALLDPARPIKIDAYIFNFTNNQWDFLDDFSLDVVGTKWAQQLGNVYDNISDTGTIFLDFKFSGTEDNTTVQVDYLDLSFKDYVKDVYTLLPYKGTVESRHTLVSFPRAVDVFKQYTGNNPEVLLDLYYRPTGFYRIKGLGSNGVTHVLQAGEYDRSISASNTDYSYRPTGILAKEYLRNTRLSSERTTLKLQSNFELGAYYTLSFNKKDINKETLNQYTLEFWQERLSTNTKQKVMEFNLADSSIDTQSNVVYQTGQATVEPLVEDLKDSDFKFYAMLTSANDEVEPITVSGLALNNSSIMEPIELKQGAIEYTGESMLNDYNIEYNDTGAKLTAPSDDLFSFNVTIPTLPAYKEGEPSYYKEIRNNANMTPAVILSYKVLNGSKTSGSVKAVISSEEETLASIYMTNNADSSSTYDNLVLPIQKDKASQVLGKTLDLMITTDSITEMQILSKSVVSFYIDNPVIPTSQDNVYLPLISNEYVLKGDMSLKFQTDSTLDTNRISLRYGHDKTHYPALLTGSDVAVSTVDDTTKEYTITSRVPYSKKGYDISGAKSYFKDKSSILFKAEDDTLEQVNTRDDTMLLTTQENPLDVSFNVYDSKVFTDYPAQQDYTNCSFYMTVQSFVDTEIKLSSNISQEVSYNIKANELERVSLPLPINKGRETAINVRLQASSNELEVGGLILYSEDNYRVIEENEPIKLALAMSNTPINLKEMEVTVPPSENAEEGDTDAYLTATSTSGTEITMFEYRADSLNRERKNYTLHGNYTNIASITYHSDGLLKNVEIERSIDGKHWKKLHSISGTLAKDETETVQNELIGKYGIDTFSLSTLNPMSKVLLSSVWETKLGDFDADSEIINNISNEFFNTTFTNLRHIAQLPDNVTTVITDARGGNMDNSRGVVIPMYGGEPQSRAVMHMNSETLTKYTAPLLAGSYVQLDELGTKTFNDTTYEVDDTTKAYSYHS